MNPKVEQLLLGKGHLQCSVIPQLDESALVALNELERFQGFGLRCANVEGVSNPL